MVAAVIVIISLGNGLTGMVEQQVEKVGINQIYAYNWGFGGGALTLDAQDIYDLVACCSTMPVRPLPREMMTITAATPMMMPSMVRRARILLVRRLLMASLKDCPPAPLWT